MLVAPFLDMPLYDPPPDDPKAARFHAVAHAVVEVLLQRGPPGVTVSAISRRSGVSRAWIYKYFGRDTEGLVDFTLRELGSLVAGLDLERDGSSLESWRRDVVAATRVGLRHAEVAPWGAALFFRYRNTPGRLGEAVRVVEARHVEAFVADMPASLRADRAAATTFASVFSAARLGAFVWWSDASVRAAHDEEGVLSHLLGMLDAFVQAQSLRGS